MHNKLIVLMILICYLALSFFTLPAFASESQDKGHITVDTANGKVIINSGNSDVTPESAYSLVLSEYKKIALGISGLCTITALICLIFNITKLGASGANEQARIFALKGILFSGIALGLFGGATIFVGFFWNVLL